MPKRRSAGAALLEERPEVVRVKYKKVLAAAKEATASERDRWRRKRPINGYRPFMKDGEPYDLVGTVLTELGVHIPKRYNESSVKRLRTAGVIDCSDKTLQLLSIMQDQQDDGEPFGPSLWMAECVIATHNLPWEKGKEIE